MSSTPNTKTSQTKKIKPFNKGKIVDFESLSLLSLKKYRSQFRIRIKPSVPKSELAAAIAEHFAAIPDPEEDEVINKFLFTLQKNRTICSETEESGDEPLNKKVSLSLKKKSTTNHDTTETKTSEDLLVINNQKNALQSNTKKNVKKNNSTTKVEKTQASR